MRFDVGWEAEIGRAEARPFVVVPHNVLKAEGHASACPGLPLPCPGGWRKRTQPFLIV
jgi:hypothetical protein